MKRPLALIGLTSMLVLTVCFYADFWWLGVLLGLSLAGLLITLVVKKLRQKPELPAFFAVVLVTVIGFNIFSAFYVQPVQNEYQGQSAEITAVLIDEPETYNGKEFYTLRTKAINGTEKKLKIILSTKSYIKCEVGDNLEFTAELESADYGKYLADKVYLRAYTYESVEVTEAEHKPFYYYIVKLRQNIRNGIYENLDFDVADFASAVLLGDGIINSENYDALRRAGLTHIVVVSGLHLSIITMFYTKTVGRRIKNKYINVSIAVLLILFFLFITGFGKSTIRAAIMLFVLLSSKLFKRKGDSLNSLGFAAMLLCFLNPYIVGDVGVLLSFSATFGIVVFSPPLNEFLTRWLKPEYLSSHKRINKSVRMFFELLATTTTASLTTLPINVLFFGKVSLVQILSNLLVAPLVKWFMIFVALCILPIPFVADVFAFIANSIGKVMLYITKLFASLPMAYVKADYDFVILWIFATILLFAVAYILRRNGKGLHFLCVLMSTMIFIAGYLGQVAVSHNRITVYVAPSDEGQSIILSSKDGNILLCSSDNSYLTFYTEQILENIYTENRLAVYSSENIWEYGTSLFDYQDVLMYDNICKEDLTINLWNKGLLYVFERQEQVYQYIDFDDKSILILPSNGDVKVLPDDMRNADVLITSGIVDNMELLSFNTLISNGNDFISFAVIDYFRNSDINSTVVSETVKFDIVG